MARVSFAGVKRIAIAIAWVVLFILVGGVLTFGISELVPGWGGQNWAVARIGAFEVIGFGLATLIVGRLLNKYSWDRMGWRRSVWPQLGRGALLGVAMAALAIGLAVVLDGARVHVTGDWNVWPRVALPLIVGLIFAALGEELGFRGYPLRRLGDGMGVLPGMLLLAILFGLGHAKNPNATVFSTVNVALAAIWLSIVLLSGRDVARLGRPLWLERRAVNSVRCPGQRIQLSGARCRIHAGPARMGGWRSVRA